MDVPFLYGCSFLAAERRFRLENNESQEKENLPVLRDFSIDYCPSLRGDDNINDD
jgi:hypothetical protein